ncbi:MAG: hypothetical protein WKF70_13130 [Chitinophagaceae bacterium]
MQPISPLNKILVQFDKKYQDEIITESGLILYKDTSYNPEWNVTVTGKVISVPPKLVSERNVETGQINFGEIRHKIFPDVRPGDELFFSYLVVHDKEVETDSDAFQEQTEPASKNKVFLNGKKEKLSIQYLSKRLVVGIWAKANGDLIAGSQGTPKETEKWMLQFKFAGDDQTIYKNLLWHEEEDYWMVDYLEAIAVKRGEEIIMIAGNVLMEPQEEKLYYERGPDSVLHLVPKIDKGVSTVVAVGKPLSDEPDLGIKAGDKIRFIQRHVQKYELWDKQYLLIDQRSILGKHNDA